MTEENKTISFGRKEVDPSKEEVYRKKIEEARKGTVDVLKGSTPLGHTEKPQMPILVNQRQSSEPNGFTPDGGIAPRPAGSPTIRQETAAQLKSFAEASAKEAEKEAKAVEQAKKEIEDEYDEFDLSPRNEAQLILANKKRRKEIEARCESMPLEDLILKGEVRQVIPIIPGKFVVELRSTLPEESLFVKKKVAEGRAISDQHTLERYGLLQLCCSLVSINGDRFPSHLDENQVPDELLFGKKYERMMKLSGYVINDLMVNLGWFDIRVRKLFSTEAMGNG